VAIISGTVNGTLTLLAKKHTINVYDFLRMNGEPDLFRIDNISEIKSMSVATSTSQKHRGHSDVTVPLLWELILCLMSVLNFIQILTSLTARFDRSYYGVQF